MARIVYPTATLLAILPDVSIKLMNPVPPQFRLDYYVFQQRHDAASVLGTTITPRRAPPHARQLKPKTNE